MLSLNVQITTLFAFNSGLLIIENIAYFCDQFEVKTTNSLLISMPLIQRSNVNINISDDWSSLLYRLRDIFCLYITTHIIKVGT